MTLACMKTRRRVLVVARHFWPTTNDDALRLYHWTQYLRGQGSEVTVATPRWHATWPQHIMCDGVSVRRLDYPPTRTLRLSSYARQLCQWLAREAGQFDLVYCDSPDPDAASLLNHVAQLQGAPLVVRYQATADDSKSRAKTVDVCRRASLVLVNSPLAEQQLLAEGLDRNCILRATQIHGSSFDRAPEARRAARQVLAEANHDLFARSQDRVLVCPGEMTRAWGIPQLIQELSPLIEEHRGLRVWILGDSRERPAIYEMLRYEGLHRLVAMPGIFTDLEEVLQAADLCVFPAAGLGLGWLLPTCIASSIPVLVSDSCEARRMLGDQASELTVQFDLPRELRGRVAQWLNSPARLSQSIATVRKYSVSSSAAGLGVDDLLRTLETITQPYA